MNSSRIKFLITTSRNPNHFLRRTSKVLSFSLPKSEKINRGSLNLNSLFSYCLNHRISQLIILQNTAEKVEALIKIFSIEEKIHELAPDSIIRLTNIIEIKKHDKLSRIIIDKIKIGFSLNVDRCIKKKIIDFFNPVTNNSNSKNHSKLLKINFRQISATGLIGEVFQFLFSPPVLLYKIHILRKCDDNHARKV